MWPFKNKKPQKPAFPEAMIAEAKRNPGGHVYAIDPTIGSQWGEVPSFAIRGAYSVDQNGELTGEYKENHNYDAEKVAAYVAAQSTSQKVQ